MARDLEVPLGKRSKAYRLLEMLPATLSYGMITLLVVLALVHPLAAAVYLLIIIITLLVKAVGIAFRTIQGRSRLERAVALDWRGRLEQLEDAKTALAGAVFADESFGAEAHRENLKDIVANPSAYPKPSQIYNAVIIAAYNEDYEVLEPTVQSVKDTTYDNKDLIVVLAYEERGGPKMKQVAQKLQQQFEKDFYTFEIVEHPDGLPNEVVGKGGNITYAGKWLRDWLPKKDIRYEDVIVTTLDADNRPHRTYFDYLTYEYIVHEDRKHLSYQPVCLFFNNIWDAPAPMRVVATGNSFWNIISSMRPHMLRNFASHSQPMDALVEMNFWSTRTIVEDGHQYWRSYFHFDGNYSVTPIYAPIYQDAVMANTYMKTLKAQFVQLRRWAWGASDVPYVAIRVLGRHRNVPLLGGLARLIRLIDGHVTLASIAILVAVGGWVPLLINWEAARLDPIVHQLPDTVAMIQRVAMIGILITIFISFKMLPQRPARYRRHRSVWMLLQWVMMPIIAVVYNSAAALYSQARLFLGLYLDKFDVTEKATAESVERARKERKSKKK